MTERTLKRRCIKRDKWHVAKKLQALNSVSYSSGWRPSWNLRKSQWVRTSLFVSQFQPESGPHGAGRDQSCMSPLPVVVQPQPRLATALLKDQQQHPATASSPVSKALLILDATHPANFTHFISGSSFLTVLCPLVSACAVSSSWNSFSLVTNSDDGNTNDNHLLGTSLCQTLC